MNFNEAFKHYEEGTATEEEVAYVKDEIAKAKALSPLFDDEALAVTPVAITEADKQEVKAAKKQFKSKYIMIVAVALLTTILVLGAILGGVFGAAASYAKEQIAFSKSDCEVFAKSYLCDWLNSMQDFSNSNITSLPSGTLKYSTDEMRVKDIDTDFHFEIDLDESYYSYKYEIEARGQDYKVNVDTRDGSLCKSIRMD